MARDDESAQGVLEIHAKGYGFLRNAARNFAPLDGDAYVAQQFIQKLRLREGLLLSGPLEPPRRGMGPRLARIDTIEGEPPRKVGRIANSTNSPPSTPPNKSFSKPVPNP